MNNGFKDASLNKLIIEKQLRNYILFVIQALEAMRKDLMEKGNSLPNHEEKIRNYLYKNYLQNDEYKKSVSFDKERIRFEIESPENYDENTYIYVGRVDIKILGEESLIRDNAYNIIECKRIDGTLTLNKKYIEEGLKRFTTEKYSSYNNQNAMLGFVVKNIDIIENTKNIDKIQQEDEEIKVIEFRKIEDMEKECYKGVYNESRLKIWHVFFDISNIIYKEESNSAN